MYDVCVCTYGHVGMYMYMANDECTWTCGCVCIMMYVSMHWTCGHVYVYDKCMSAHGHVGVRACIMYVYMHLDMWLYMRV